MMKSAVMLSAALAMVSMSAAEIDVNGAFKASKPGQPLPDKWVFNNGPKPAGSHKMVRNGDKNAVAIKAEKSMYGIAWQGRVAAKPGDRFALSVNASGDKASVNVGMFIYGPKGCYLKGNYDKNVTLTGKTANVKRIITVPAAVKVKGQDLVPEAIGVVFLVWAPGEATFDTFKLEKLD